MKLLVLDTSTEWCSAALWLDGAIQTRRVLAGQQHSSLLLPMVDELLRESAIGLRQLAASATARVPARSPACASPVR